jgi:hypothetical protein
MLGFMLQVSSNQQLKAYVGHALSLLDNGTITPTKQWLFHILVICLNESPLRAIDTSVIEPSTKTKQKQVYIVCKNIRF